MFWDYIQLPDETQVAYSDMHKDGTVEVRIERPVDMGFNSARCMLPAFTWSDVEGFTDDEMKKLDALVKNNAPLIFEFAQADPSERLTA